MSWIRLPSTVTHEDILENLNRVGALDKPSASYVIEIPRGCFVSSSALALLCSWGQLQIRRGATIRFEGDDDTLRYIARMDLFRVLNVPYTEKFDRHAEAGRFVPICQIQDTRDCWNAITRVGDLVLHQFDNAREFFPAMEWAINEVIDNITIHSDTPIPGIVCAQYFPKRKRVDIGICDMGRGIKSSLSERYELWSHGDAITKALERGATRNPAIGQGNGLAGTFEIAKVNGGIFHLWSGNACFKMVEGKPEKFTIIPSMAGTGIYLSLKTDRPVNLRAETFMGASQFSDNESTYIYGEGERATAGGGLIVKNECVHTGSREPARALRRKILSLLPEVDSEPLLLNFAEVNSASSSFLDELLSRLIVEIGLPAFKKKVKVVNATETIKDMANVVIKQRLETRESEPLASDD